MKLIIKSIGENYDGVRNVIKEFYCYNKEFGGGNDENVDNTMKNIKKRMEEGKKFVFISLKEDDAIFLADKLTDAGAQVEIDKRSFMEKAADVLSNIIIKPLEKIIDLDEKIFEKHPSFKTPLIAVELILALSIAGFLLFKFWALFLFIVFIFMIICIYLDKEKFSDNDRDKLTMTFFNIGKWIAIGAVIIALAKPAFSLIDPLIPGYPVRNGYLVQYSEVMTVDEMFDHTFKDSKWSSFKENGVKYVMYTGVEKEDGSIYQFIFMVRGDGCAIDSIYVDGLDYTYMGEVLLYSLYRNAGAIE